MVDADGSGSGAAVTQTRAANAANEIGTVNGTSGTGGAFATANYDDAGNQIAGPKGDTPTTPIGYVYDGWNRLVGVDATNNGSLTDAGDVKYAYDGTGRRITKFTDSTNDSTNNAGSTEEYFQNEQNQVLEVRIGTVAAGVKTVNVNPKERYFWDPTYIDAPIAMEFDTNTDGTRDTQLFATWDLSHNVDSLVTTAGKIVEHYAYTPYGQRTVINGASNYAGTGADADGAEWTVDTNGSDYGNLLGFQGLRFSPESGNWEADARPINPVQGTWIGRDPTLSGYPDGTNLYQGMDDNPIMHTDPMGTVPNTEQSLALINWSTAWHFVTYTPGPSIGGSPGTAPGSVTGGTNLITALYAKSFQVLHAACDQLDQLYFTWGPVQTLVGRETSTITQTWAPTITVSPTVAFPVGSGQAIPVTLATSTVFTGKVNWGGKSGSPTSADPTPSPAKTPVTKIACSCSAHTPAIPSPAKLA